MKTFQSNQLSLKGAAWPPAIGDQLWAGNSPKGSAIARGGLLGLALWFGLVFTFAAPAVYLFDPATPRRYRSSSDLLLPSLFSCSAFGLTRLS